jgi:hypothetical protein
MPARIHIIGTDRSIDVEDDPRNVINQMVAANEWLELTDVNGDTVQVNPKFVYLVGEQPKPGGSAAFQ